MTLLRGIGEFVSRWLEVVAATIVAAFGRFVSPRVVRIVEESDGRSFTLSGAENGGGRRDRLATSDGGPFGALPPDAAKAIKGNRVEIVLRPARFLFRPLELPRRAVEFLDGIVRAQIDRLTPWTATDAVFGWGRPADIASDRISIMVAATARAAMRPMLDALAEFGPASIAIFTAPADGAAAAGTIKVYDQSVRGTLDAMRLSRILLVVLLIAAVAASLAVAADATLGASLEARQNDLTRSINQRRAALRGGQAGITRSASAILDRRKQETPATVIVLEALSAVLPDHTYVTELRVEGGRLQVIGVTQDAPGLIRLMEQSPHFRRATFFAPTTRSATDPGERFHIEAQIEPINTPRS
jgi:general secretion pathway protein L